MKLVSVDKANLTPYQGYIDMSVTWEAVEGNKFYTPGIRQDEYTWHKDDPYGLSPQITEWLAAHPDFPIGPVVGE